MSKLVASGDDDLKVKLFRDPDKADICGTILHIDDDDWASYGHKFSEHNQVEVKKSLCSRKRLGKNFGLIKVFPSCTYQGFPKIYI